GRSAGNEPPAAGELQPGRRQRARRFLGSARRSFRLAGHRRRQQRCAGTAESGRHQSRWSAEQAALASAPPCDRRRLITPAPITPDTTATHAVANAASDAAPDANADATAAPATAASCPGASTDTATDARTDGAR